MALWLLHDGPHGCGAQSAHRLGHLVGNSAFIAGNDDLAWTLLPESTVLLTFGWLSVENLVLSSQLSFYTGPVHL